MNRKLILSLLALIFLAQVGVKAQGVDFKKFSEAFPVQEALRIDDKTFFHSSDQEASFVYVPNLAQLKPILKSLPCGESLRFSYGRRVVTERYVALHFYLSCDVPSPGKLPYNKAVLATFTPAGKLIDYTTFLMHSDEGHTLLLGTLAPYLLAALGQGAGAVLGVAGADHDPSYHGSDPAPSTCLTRAQCHPS